MMNNIEMKIPLKDRLYWCYQINVSGNCQSYGVYIQGNWGLIGIGETFINAVQYAYPEDEVGQLTIGFRTYEDKLEVMVVDSGKSFNFIQIKNELGSYIIKYSGRIVRGGN